jgi:hypothetical protein
MAKVPPPVKAKRQSSAGLVAPVGATSSNGPEHGPPASAAPAASEDPEAANDDPYADVPRGIHAKLDVIKAKLETEQRGSPDSSPSTGRRRTGTVAARAALYNKLDEERFKQP